MKAKTGDQSRPSAKAHHRIAGNGTPPDEAPDGPKSWEGTMLTGYPRRQGRTDEGMLASGAWAKVGRKEYRHESGARVIYRPNAHLWEIVGGAADGLRYERLWPARDTVERRD